MCSPNLFRRVNQTGGISDDLIAVADDRTDVEEDDEVGVPWFTVLAEPGEVSLKMMLAEIDKLNAVRFVGVPKDLLDDVAPGVVSLWRIRVAVESPSHLRRHRNELHWSLMATMIVVREPELADVLVELLIKTVHRIGARSREEMTVARAKGKLKGRQPKLSTKQQIELQRMHQNSDHTNRSFSSHDTLVTLRPKRTRTVKPTSFKPRILTLEEGQQARHRSDRQWRARQHGWLDETDPTPSAGHGFESRRPTRQVEREQSSDQARIVYRAGSTKPQNRIAQWLQLTARRQGQI